MSKKSLIYREKKRNFLTNKYYLLRNNFKKKIRISNNYEDKMNLYFKLQLLPRNSSSTRLF